MNHFCVEIEADLRPVGKEQALDPSVDFDTPDLTPCQHRHREQLSSLQAGGLAVGDLSTVVVTGTASHQQPCQHRSRARHEGIRQNGFAEGLVCATRVEFIAEKVEPVWLRLGGQDVAGERILDRKRIAICTEPQPELTVENKSRYGPRGNLRE